MVSKGAQELYEWIKEQSTIESGSIVYDSMQSFWDDYKVWLDELINEGWIQKYQNSFVIFLGSMKTVYFKDNCQCTKQERALERYQPNERRIIEAALVSFGGKKRSGKLTPRQALLELEYYFKYPRGVIVSALTTYLNLPSQQQYGSQYARGIIRNGSKGSLLSANSTAMPIIEAPPDHEAQKKKAEWVRSRLDERDFLNCRNKEESRERVRELEVEYDELHK